MKIPVIGGTAFIGRFLERQLADMGHAVTLLHRGGTAAELPAESILGERRDLASLHPKTDVVIDLIANPIGEFNPHKFDYAAEDAV